MWLHTLYSLFFAKYLFQHPTTTYKVKLSIAHIPLVLSRFASSNEMQNHFPAESISSSDHYLPSLSILILSQCAGMLHCPSFCDNVDLALLLPCYRTRMYFEPMGRHRRCGHGVHQGSSPTSGHRRALLPENRFVTSLKDLLARGDEAAMR